MEGATLIEFFAPKETGFLLLTAMTKFSPPPENDLSVETDHNTARTATSPGSFGRGWRKKTSFPVPPRFALPRAGDDEVGNFPWAHQMSGFGLLANDDVRPKAGVYLVVHLSQAKGKSLKDSNGPV